MIMHEEAKQIFNLPENEQTPKEKKLLAENPMEIIHMKPAQRKVSWRQISPKQTEIYYPY